MGKRGPKPTPTAILKMRDSGLVYGRTAEPSPAPSMPACPAWASEAVRQQWAVLSAHLEPLRIVTDGDQLAIGALLDALADYLRAKELVAEHGEIAHGEKGGPYMHPAVAIRAGAWDRLLKALREFGLTPSSRSGVKVLERREPSGKRRIFTG